MTEWKVVRTQSEGAKLIAVERERQIEKEGWTAEHDEQHSRFELARAALCYLEYATSGRALLSVPKKWPWDSKWWKPKNPLRDLVRAGALIAAEIDRRIIDGV